METKGLESLDQFRGKTLEKLCTHDELARGFKVVAKIDPDLCVKCHVCMVTCRDFGGDAIKAESDRIAFVDEEKCKGCGVCTGVCPVPDCIITTIANSR